MKAPLVVAIVGRPNVGKSSLFNALVEGPKKSITYNAPGVTRDRHYGLCHWEGREVALVDTGGFFPGGWAQGPLEVAIDESDLVFLVVDGREGVSPLDEMAHAFLKKQGKEIFLVVNKIDTPKQQGLELAFFRLGVSQERLLSVSAAHAQGLSELRARVALWEGGGTGGLSWRPGEGPRVAIMGGPNVGKSTLLNHLAGHLRALVSPAPGTTVDPVEGSMLLGHQRVSLVDTAGIRKKSLAKEFVEAQSTYRSIHCLKESDGVVFLIDATKGITHQDVRLLELAYEKGKSLVVGANKMDLIPSGQGEALLARVKERIPWPAFSVLSLSAKDGRGLGKLQAALACALACRGQSVPTSQLNSLLQGLVRRHRVEGVKIQYASLVKTSPPTFLLFCRGKKKIPDNYKKYLHNRLRVGLGYHNTPIRLVFTTS